jgi:hypothetical protein
MRLSQPTTEHYLRLEDGESSVLSGRIETMRVAVGSKSERETALLRVDDGSACLLWVDGAPTFGPPALFAFNGWAAEVEGEWKHGKLRVSALKLKNFGTAESTETDSGQAEQEA